VEQLKRVRYIKVGDKKGHDSLIALGYSYRGVSKKNNQIFVLSASPGIETETLDAVETSFGLERDLQAALRRNIEQLEDGLSIMDDGKEKQVLSGRVDITAKDKQGSAVVIELKAGTADRETVGQIIGYMGDLQPANKSVRGIIVAGDFTQAAVSALGTMPNLQLKKYGFKFTFTSVRRTGTDGN
jgi:RecB family endonuclease NucS